MTEMPARPILELDGVGRIFARKPDIAARIAHRLVGSPLPARVRAVDDVSFTVQPGEVLGLVGESGCGKSTLARMISGILTPTSGRIRFEGGDMADMSAGDRRRAGLAVQMVFQDPMSSLNPRLRVVDIIGEAPVAHGLVRPADQDGYVCDMMERVGLDPTRRYLYAHQFSGGQRARIGIARALAVQPRVLICDESTAALDVSIQSQILNLFMDLRAQMGLTYIFVSHDLGVVQHISDRIAVMYLGRVVELAGAEDLFAAPQHPYTRALLAEVPRLEPKKRQFTGIKGEMPSPLNPPSGCHFHPRCAVAVPACATRRPALRALGAGRMAACDLIGEEVAD
ncbi:MAG: ATP-binding cassette domain-containing protein [Gemmobacter sp.]|nr:ATP-binding cassette domain-containing protein [Gemmobacter sp.]